MAGKNSSNSSMRQENRIEHGISAMRNLIRAMLCEYKWQNGDACRESKTRMSALSEGASNYGRWARRVYLGDEAALLIAFNLSEVGVGPPVHHHFIQNLILLPLHGLAITENLTEEAHTQCDVHALHLHMQHEHDMMSNCQQGLNCEPFGHAGAVQTHT